MPLAFLAVVGFVLVMLLFTADATLEKLTQASIQTSVAAPAPATHVIWEPVKTPKPWARWRLTIQRRRELRRHPRTIVSPARMPPVGYRQNNASSYREFGLSGLR